MMPRRLKRAEAGRAHGLQGLLDFLKQSVGNDLGNSTIIRMRVIPLLGTLIFAFYVNAQTPAAVWDQLKAKRDNLTGVHQEFEISKTQEYGRDSRSLKWGIVVDMSMGLWRETSPNGFGSPIRIFDGK